MKTAAGYILRNIEGTNYLLPVGQTIALRRKGLRLNNTGALLWNAIQSGMEENDLLAYLVNYYRAEDTDLPTLQADINFFLRELTNRNILCGEEKVPDCNTYLNIGGIIIGYHGPEHLLHPSLQTFKCNQNSVGQHWIIIPRASDPYALGELIIRTNEIEIIRTNEDYVINLLSLSPSIQIKVSLDGVYARFYCILSYDQIHVELLFQAFRHAFLIYAQKQGCFVLHSSSILYQNKVWLFSAPSGTGKSTQAEYWRNLFHARILNGDLNMIRFDTLTPTISGLPWCGTSNIYSNETHVLGGIVLLKKHSDNLIHELTKPEQELSIAQRLISPAWTEDMLSDNLEFSHRLIQHIPVFRFLCKKEPLAAHVLRQYIHQF